MPLKNSDGKSFADSNGVHIELGDRVVGLYCTPPYTQLYGGYVTGCTPKRVRVAFDQCDGGQSVMKPDWLYVVTKADTKSITGEG